MNFDQLLESIGCPFSGHEVQGYMIGLLSQNLKNNYKTELDTYPSIQLTIQNVRNYKSIHYFSVRDVD